MTAPNLYIPAWVFEAGPHVERAEVFVNPRDVSGLVRVEAVNELARLTAALGTTCYNGGMCGETWDRAAARAIERAHGIVPATPDAAG